MKSRNFLKLLFVILASASVAKQSSAILPAALIPASTLGKCLALWCASSATELLYRTTYKKIKEEKNKYERNGSIFDKWDWIEDEENPWGLPKLILLCGYYYDKHGNRHEIPRLPIINKANLAMNTTSQIAVYFSMGAIYTWIHCMKQIITGQV